MKRSPFSQYNDRDDVDEHYDNNKDDDNHHVAVEMNAGDSDGANKNRDSPAFAVKSIRQFNVNVITRHLTMGDRRWYIVECYLAPFDNTTIRYVEAAMVEWPRAAEQIFAGDLNVDMERTTRQILDEEIAVAVTTVRLEEISVQFLLLQRAWN